MTEKISTFISKELRLPLRSVINTLSLLRDDNSIPFISRYRKEATGNLDERDIQRIEARMKYYEDLQKRRATILKTIEAQGKLTEELSHAIMNCWDATQLEDLYLPFKPKRRTRAQVAREQGLEPLAERIMRQNPSDNPSLLAEAFVTDEVPSVELALNGAKDIIAERVSENASVRERVRAAFRREATFNCHVVKGKEIEGRKYESYYEFCRPLAQVLSHQLLAARRGEKEGFLSVSITIDDERAAGDVARTVVKGQGGTAALVEQAARDSYSRLIRPSIENEFGALTKTRADDDAITTFASNVKQLLFAPPLGHKRLLAIDPGFRTGCKIVCLDEQGNLLHNDVIYPTAPHHDTKGATEKLLDLEGKYDFDCISLGDGTASRETQEFLKKVPFTKHVEVHVVSESGASIYSASQVAREEFPDKDVTVRGAVSIGRRLLDPLAELVKIDPKSIGVGQYQHDVDQTRLKEALNFTVEECVNKVGVNVNTASKELLTYVSGLGPVLAKNIVNYRSEHGDFTSRKQLLKVPKLGPKTFTQSAGFLRVPQSDNPLDNSAVHPERYELVKRMAADCGCTVEQLIREPEKRALIDAKRYVSPEVGMLTINDIMRELEKPGRDPRGKAETVAFDVSVTSIEHLKVGMELNGIVTNVTQFGAFVNIGVHKDGLVAMRNLSDRWVNDPQKVVRMHQHVRVRVLSVDLERGRISLSMRDLEQPGGTKREGPHSRKHKRRKR